MIPAKETELMNQDLRTPPQIHVEVEKSKHDDHGAIRIIDQVSQSTTFNAHDTTAKRVIKDSGLFMLKVMFTATHSLTDVSVKGSMTPGSCKRNNEIKQCSALSSNCGRSGGIRDVPVSRDDEIANGLSAIVEARLLIPSGKSNGKTSGLTRNHVESAKNSRHATRIKNKRKICWTRLEIMKTQRTTNERNYKYNTAKHKNRRTEIKPFRRPMQFNLQKQHAANKNQIKIKLNNKARETNRGHHRTSIHASQNQNTTNPLSIT